MNNRQEFLRKQELQVAQPEPDAVMLPMSLTPAQLVQVAVQRGETIEFVRELIQLEREWKADRAKEAFHAAMAEFKKVPLTIKKDKENKQYSSKEKGGPKAMYASLGNMVNTVNAAMAPFGLNASWEIDQTAGIKVTCVLTHTLGHSKSVPMTGPLDSSGAKNPLQQIRSTVTYLESATFQAVTGVVSQDATLDDDGNGSSGETIGENQVADLEALITEVGADRTRFLKHIKVAALDEILSKNYTTVVNMLEAKRGRK
jgi:hypothetical protein